MNLLFEIQFCILQHYEWSDLTSRRISNGPFGPSCLFYHSLRSWLTFYQFLALRPYPLIRKLENLPLRFPLNARHNGRSAASEHLGAGFNPVLGCSLCGVFMFSLSPHIFPPCFLHKSSQHFFYLNDILPMAG